MAHDNDNNLFVVVTGDDVRPQRLQSYIDVEKLEKEYVLTSAEYLLSVANVKWKFIGNILILCHIISGTSFYLLYLCFDIMMHAYKHSLLKLVFLL